MPPEKEGRRESVSCGDGRGGRGTGKDPSPRPGDLDPCVGDEAVAYLSMPEVQVRACSQRAAPILKCYAARLHLQSCIQAFPAMLPSAQCVGVGRRRPGNRRRRGSGPADRACVRLQEALHANTTGLPYPYDSCGIRGLEYDRCHVFPPPANKVPVRRVWTVIRDISTPPVSVRHLFVGDRACFIRS